MNNLWLVCFFTKLNFINWKKNPRIWMAFLCAFVFCVMLSGRALVFAKNYDTNMQILEPFVWAFGNGNSVMMVSLLLLLFVGDMPFVTDLTPYTLIRTKRKIWLLGQMLYVVLVTVIYLFFLLLVFCILCAPMSFIGNLWSETGALLGYSGVGAKIALPSSVKIMEMSTPYKCTASIFLLMVLYTLLAATIMMIFNLEKNRFGGVLSLFILNLYGLLLDPQIIAKIFRIPDSLQYKSNVICGWLSPLNHATYYMHNFGYDLLPRLWQSYCILGTFVIINLILSYKMIRKYEFRFL